MWLGDKPCSFEDNFVFLERARNHLELSGDKLLGVREVGRVEQEGRLFFSRSRNLDHGTLVCIETEHGGMDRAQALGPDRLAMAT